ncbi:hypothetical protein VNI00_002298 [Paramarasmius palmivorus]|uniref:Uncharacterized protein n=1 Tax=Paramarasmius palmivorus TaxID=297713 RepID=A0AAW0E760_9AGAR
MAEPTSSKKDLIQPKNTADDISFSGPELDALSALEKGLEKRNAQAKVDDLVAESSNAASKRENSTSKKRKRANVPPQSEFVTSFYSSGPLLPGDVDEEGSVPPRTTRRISGRISKGKPGHRYTDSSVSDHEATRPTRSNASSSGKSEERKGKMREQSADVPKSTSGRLTIKLLLPSTDRDAARTAGTASAMPSPIDSSIHVDSVESDAGSDDDEVPDKPTEDEITLENLGPVPVYPAPTKPFPVLPPPKFSSALAPTIPLDKTHAKVRHWRVAKREIRGIAGGRWFTRAWVGEKASQFAEQKGKVGDTKESDSVSTSAPVKSKASTSSKKRKAGSNPSASQVPDGTSTRKPTKLRISLVAAASSEPEDADMEG